MAESFNPQNDFMRMMADFRMPDMMSFEAFAAAQRRNMEALSAANRVALEGAQAVAKRHMEILQQSMTEMTDAMRGMASAEAPQEKAAKQEKRAAKPFQLRPEHFNFLWVFDFPMYMYDEESKSWAAMSCSLPTAAPAVNPFW